MGRPKKAIEKRISGTGYTKGSIGYNNLKYKRLSADKKTYEIDTDKIKTLIQEYLEEHSYTVDETTNKRIITRINRVGLRLKLDISRETYLCYLQGYTNRNDMDDEGKTCNHALSDALRIGDDAILQYLITNDDKYGQTKYIRLLEAYGELSPQKQVVDINANINLGKWGKRSK